MAAAHPDNRFDVLRLLAAWLVLFSHSYPLSGLPLADPLVRSTALETWGGVGVSVFFVLSGYLVTLSLERSTGLFDFAWRRIIRIYPAMVALCLACVLVLGPSLTTLPLTTYFGHPFTPDYLWTATAWDIHYVLPGVFATNPVANVVNGSLWSMQYEITCYLVLAAVWLLRLPLRWAALAALVWLVALLLGKVVLVGTIERFWGVDYNLIKLGIPFAVGAGFAAWRQRATPHLVIGLALIAIAWALPGSPWRTLAFCLGTSITALALALKALWLPPIPKRMGDWSYGMYLYGFPVQQLAAHAGVQRHGFEVYLLVCTLGTAALAAASWYMVERPALRLKRRNASAPLAVTPA